MTTASHDHDTPEVRVFHHPTGWTLPALSPDRQDCTTNYTPEHADMPPCTATAVWKVVEHRGLGLTLSFWCDNHLPTEHRPAA